ncbi:hypothetical protein GWF43_08925 [Salmonella enterica]|nr:hypothetical protein [Salmonella enterica]
MPPMNNTDLPSAQLISTLEYTSGLIMALTTLIQQLDLHRLIPMHNVMTALRETKETLEKQKQKVRAKAVQNLIANLEEYVLKQPPQDKRIQ